MFEDVMNFARPREGTQALGWYIVFAVLWLAIVFGLAIVIAFRDRSLGLVAALQYSNRVLLPGGVIYVAGLGILLLVARPLDATNIGLVISGALTAGIHPFLGLIVPAVLSTRPVR